MAWTASSDRPERERVRLFGLVLGDERLLVDRGVAPG